MSTKARGRCGGAAVVAAVLVRVLSGCTPPPAPGPAPFVDPPSTDLPTDGGFFFLDDHGRADAGENARSRSGR